MAIRTELCRFETADGEMLHGLLFRPDGTDQSDVALLQVHGVGGAFYRGPLPAVGQLLAERGYHVMPMNTRGHDWITRGRNPNGFIGATYENLEDCLPDIDGGLAYLSSRGYRRFVLFGHSLGSIKVLFYQGQRTRSDVVGIVSSSAPRQFYAARAIEQPDFPQRMAEAEVMVEEGKGEEFLRAPTSGATGIFTARTYVSKYGRHEHNDVRKDAAGLTVPLLATAGGKESDFFHMHCRELAEAAGPELGTSRIIEGALHSYAGYEAVLADTVEGWLRQLRVAPDPAPQRGRA
jgi:pimeloyl-ACP methyl ester carboxylesterase